VENGSILVTGGSGFIGTNLVNRLIADGYVVTNLDKSPPGQ
jgi:nucleoside-diphosphate-sugar epimerase